MRILVVLPLYGGSLPIGRYCEKALRKLGHLVDVFEAPDFYPTYQALKNLNVTVDRLEYLQSSYLQTVSQAVLAKVETFEPDLVLAMAQAPMSRQCLKRLRKDGIPTAMWFVEDFRLFTYWQAYAAYYDIFAVIQKEPFFERLREVGQENSLYLPLGADPDFHAPMRLTSVERRKWGSDVSFMGAGYPNRRVAFKQLLGYDFKIWGNEWDGDVVLEPYNQLKGKRLTPEECVAVFNATRININLHSSVDPSQLVSGGDFVNPRTFELASCAAFQLVDEREFLDEAFTRDEVVRFSSVSELKEKIDYYLAHEEKRQEIALRACERVLKEHTYEKRMQALLDFASERLDGWPRRRKDESSVLAGLPDELRLEISGLLERLGLSEETSFEDVVHAVRSRQGKLDSIDTAILFLDEWRKQYGVRTRS